jgi:hypothetical protein
MYLWTYQNILKKIEAVTVLAKLRGSTCGTIYAKAFSFIREYS